MTGTPTRGPTAATHGPPAGLPIPRRYVAIVAAACGGAAVVVDAAATTSVVALYQLILVVTLLPVAALGERVGCTAWVRRCSRSRASSACA